MFSKSLINFHIQNNIHIYCNIYCIYIYIRFVYTDKVVLKFDLASIHELGSEMASIHELELGPIDVDPPKPIGFPWEERVYFTDPWKPIQINDINVGEYIQGGPLS